MMKKLAVTTIAALSLGVLYAADPQTDNNAPQPPPPAPDNAPDAVPPKPLPPLDETPPDHPMPRKHDWKKGDRQDDGKGGPKGMGPGEAKRERFEKFREMREHGRPDFGSGGEGREKPKFGHGEMLGEALNLTPEQKKKAREIMQATKPKLEAVAQESREKMRSVMDAAMQELRPSLTPEQQAVFDDLQKLRADREALKKANPPQKPEKSGKKKKDDA